MKTVNCSLPIYDNIIKQSYQRALFANIDIKHPVLTPRFRLPSWQYNTEADNVGVVTKIEAFGVGYGTETLVGSDWVTHTSWDGPLGPDDFTHTLLNITEAYNSTGTANAYSNTFQVYPGTKIIIRGTVTQVAPDGGNPSFQLWDGYRIVSNVVASSAGANVIELISTTTGLVSVNLTVSGAKHFSFTGVSIAQVNSYFDLTAHFPVLSDDYTSGSDVYYKYDGDTLNYLLVPGEYYLKITHNNGFVFYSDWYKVECIYENLIDSLTNDSFETFVTSGTIVLSAIDNGVAFGYCYSDIFTARKGEKIRVIFNAVLNSGALPVVGIWRDDFGDQDVSAISAGVNDIELTADWDGNTYLGFFLNTTASNFATSEILVIRSFSRKYININFSNSCDINGLIYQDGFEQSIWLETETLEPSYPTKEEGEENGEGRFVRTFGRQVKKYLARTKELPEFMIELLYRLKMHDTIEIIDTVGNENDLYNLEVEHEWLYNDKYYGRADLTFDYDEAYVVYACCVNN